MSFARVDVQGHVATITLAPPEGGYDRAFLDAVGAAAERVAADEEVRAVVLRTDRELGAGWAAEALAEPLGIPGVPHLAAGIDAVAAVPQPVICSIRGRAHSAGLELALACDVRVASTTAKFLVANVKIGISAGEMGISYLLPRIINGGHAVEMMLTGRTVEAGEALALGLVSRVVEPDQVVPAALEHARLILSNPGFGVALSKEMIGAGQDAPSLAYALLLEDRTQVLAGYSGDIAKAIESFRAR